MIAYLKGTIEEIENGSIILEHQGIGYHIFVPGTMAEQLPVGKEVVKIHTYLHVREDVMQLYGFLTKGDLQMFQMLLSVSGIGPKGALGVLTVLPAEDLRFAILGGDANAIAKAPGVGRKTAEKVVLELKDKVDLQDAFEAKRNEVERKQASGLPPVRQEAVEALVALGYSQTEAVKLMSKIEISEGMNTEQVLKLALKQVTLF